MLDLDKELTTIIYAYFFSCLKDPIKLSYQNLVVFGAYLSVLQNEEEAKYF